MMKLDADLLLKRLVITIIVMLILAGVSLNAIIGDNGIINQATYTSFLEEMTTVQEAVDMWKVGKLADNLGEETTAIPVKRLVTQKELDASIRLAGEIGFFRTWSITGVKPTQDIKMNTVDFNSAFEAEIIAYPAGIQDLYVLDNEGIGLDNKKTYYIDAVTSIVYSANGFSVSGVIGHSVNMVNALRNGTLSAPLFASAEVSGGGSINGGQVLAGNNEPEFIDDGEGNLIKNPNYNPNGFKIIAHATNDNIYKLYNNGDLYGKGVKGNLLNTSSKKMENINKFVWKEIDVSSKIPNLVETVQGFETCFFIDSKRELWAIGSNRNNYLGLTEEQQKEFTGREVTKLNIDGKKVYKVIPNYFAIWVITEDNKLYVCGYNNFGQLGTGSIEQQTDRFVEVTFLNPKNISFISSTMATSDVLVKDYKTIILTNDGKIYFAGDTSKCHSKTFKDTSLEDKVVTTFTEIYNGIYGNAFSNKIVYVAFFGIWHENNMVWIDDAGNLYHMKNDGNIELIDTDVEKVYGRYSSAIYKKKNGNDIEFKFCPFGAKTWFYSLGINQNTYLEWIDISEVINNSINLNQIKDFYLMEDSLIFLDNDGNLYGIGANSNLGINKNSGLTNGIISLSSISGLEPIDELVYSMGKTCSNGFMIKSKTGVNYITNSSNLMFGDSILEGGWNKINPDGVKVKKFNAMTYSTANNLGFIDSNNDIWVLGDDVRFLGINHEEDDIDLKNFVRLKDYLIDTEIYSHIDGKVEDYAFGKGAFYIKTNSEDNDSLYVSGPYKIDEWPYYSYTGLNKEDAYIPKMLFNNVEKFCCSEQTCVMVLLKNEDFYIWGNNNKNMTSGINSELPVLYAESAYKNTEIVSKKVKDMYTYNLSSYIITKDENIYVTGSVLIPNAAVGMLGSVFKYEKFDKAVCFNNEDITDIGFLGVKNKLFLTASGNLYGCGNKNYLGLGTGNTEQQFTPINLMNKGDVVQIVAGPSWFVIIKNDGTVWGTGENKYGILGRWIGVGRGESNSRYKTAFSWVECPELEI